MIRIFFPIKKIFFLIVFSLYVYKQHEISPTLHQTTINTRMRQNTLYYYL
jgi:hypothetical protein